ncbi:proline-rich transmembrane protein 4 [Scleropages formosus]|uniref:Proline rich transmembrane protein 4 n=1 Tax=Scleropages formosus TaxID=113540 RepID=A0A8C9QWD5_SCLFO|nr:proline-rich transmembrane protein 4 [Scleropages formosus]XP_029104696.1 proline-rich transmembrane protein 4 [Scleropages formosus]XP_029104697.1 proline-rich transmembrane protein 4 [Scleropages formosus]
MLFPSWTLALCLWHSILGSLQAMSLAGIQGRRSLSQPQPIAEPGNYRYADSFGSLKDSFFWPFWTPEGGTGEARTPSFLSLPFALPFDLWSSSPKTEEEAKSTQWSLKVSSPATTTDSDPGLEDRKDASPKTAIGTSWKNAMSTPGMTTGVVLKGTRLLPSTTSHSIGHSTSHEHGTDLPWPSSSFSNDGDSFRATPTVRDTTLHTASTVKAITREATHNTVSMQPGLDNRSTTQTISAVDQEATTSPGRERTTSPELTDKPSSTSKGQTGPETMTAGHSRLSEETGQPPTAAPSVNTNSPDVSRGFERRGGEGRVEGEDPGIQWTATVSSITALGPLFAGTLPDEEWPSGIPANESYSLPDCNMDVSGDCNASDPWSPAFPDENATTNQSYNPLLLLTPPMFVPLYSDWNSAMATWGAAWEAHVYGLGSVFTLVALLSALNLLCLPYRCPSGCGYFALVNVFLLAAGASRGFSLFYDAYSHQDKLPFAGTLLLYEAPFPCLTGAFGIVFLLLSMRSRMQLSHSVLQHPCFLATLVLAHFITTFGSVALLQVFTQQPCLFFVSQGAFVLLAAMLATTYFIFYCYVRADSKHIYHLNNTSPPVERYNRCPFADAKDWERAAATAVLAALFALACAGLQLYAMLHALGLGATEVFPPWPWWAFHLSCRLCEAGVCLTLALIVMHPLYCSSDPPHIGCWPRMFRGHLAVKSPVLPNNYAWSQQEKLVICDAIGRGESECLPLYTLVEHRLSSVDGLDLLYRSNRSLAAGELDLIKAKAGSLRSSLSSLRLDSDSTADLRPPSPIDLRRSIDEALFGEALFPQSLFSTSSNLSLNANPGSERQALRESSADHSLYRTTSCGEMEAAPPKALEPRLRGSSDAASSSSSAGRWQDSSSSSIFRASLDGSSLVLCSSPERSAHGHASFGSSRIAPGHLSQSSLNQVAHLQRGYQTLGSASQESLEQPGSQDLAVQAEFISVCRQIDALSICSDTIDL